MRILLGQLGANGDCMHATVLAQQIKHDHPEALLTWAVSTACRSIVENIPGVDEVWELPNVQRGAPAEDLWNAFEREALRLGHRSGFFDRVILSQVWPSNFQNFDGTVRPSILRAYGAPITVPVRNVMVLTDDEHARVQAFMTETQLARYTHRILFECSSRSAQSFITPQLAEQIAERIYLRQPETAVVFSTDEHITLEDPRSKSGAILTIRETGGLTEHCSMMVGCGSAISVAALMTSEKRLPCVQILSGDQSVFASVAHDLEFFEQEADHILETSEEDIDALADMIVSVCRDGVDAARIDHSWRAPITFDHYFFQIERSLLKTSRFLDAAASLGAVTRRYGWTKDLITFGRERLLPNLSQDAGFAFAPGRLAAKAFGGLLDEARDQIEAQPRQRPYRIAEGNA